MASSGERWWSGKCGCFIGCSMVFDCSAGWPSSAGGIRVWTACITLSVLEKSVSQLVRWSFVVLDLFSSTTVEFYSGATVYLLLRSALHGHAFKHRVLRTSDEREQWDETEWSLPGSILFHSWTGLFQCVSSSFSVDFVLRSALDWSSMFWSSFRAHYWWRSIVAFEDAHTRSQCNTRRHVLRATKLNARCGFHGGVFSLRMVYHSVWWSQLCFSSLPVASNWAMWKLRNGWLRWRAASSHRFFFLNRWKSVSHSFHPWIDWLRIAS